MNSKGQFFSPDLAIALGVFIFSLALFWAASNVIFDRVEIFNSRLEADETAHSVLNSLVLSGGIPFDWEDHALGDINSFGLVHSNNVLDSAKIVRLVDMLNSSDYNSVKYKMGLGKYDIMLNVKDSKGNVVLYPTYLSGGQTISGAVLNARYGRIVYYNGDQALLEAIISIEE